jgi:DNA-binding CsgD family transcriptional regulator/tetratricopeptide (TPR) repeat protein
VQYEHANAITIRFVGETRLIGRDSELALLRELVEGAQAGVGGAVLVEGEQGVGKSALLRAGLAGAAEAGLTVWWGAADELDQPFPLQLAVDCVSANSAESIEPYLRTGGAVLTGDPVLARIERLLSLADQMCAVSPVLLVAENLQWADEASVTVWRRLSRAVGQMPLLLAGSARPGSGRDDLDRLRRGLIAHHGTVLALGPLSPEEIAGLVRDVLGGSPGPQLAGVLSRAGGNPLYARELAEALVREGRVRVAGPTAELAGGPDLVQVPASLAAVLQERLRGLPADVVAILRRAALLGLEFAVPDLEVLTGLTAGELMGAVEAGAAAGVLTDAGLHLGFRHALIRQLLYEEIPPVERAAAHLEAARSLAAAGAPPERIAAQLVLVLSPEEADMDVLSAPQSWVPQWLADTVAQLTYRAPQVAAKLLRAVLRQLPEADPRREELEASLVTVAFLLMRDDEVEQAGARLLERRGNPELMAAMAWLVAYARMRTGRPAEGVAAVDEALAISGVSELRAARLRALRAMILAEMGHFDEAATVAETALTGAERTGDRLGAGYALYALSKVELARRDHAARLGHIDRALLVTADDPQAADLRLMLLANKMSGLELMDRRAEAISTAQQALALAEQAGTPRRREIRTALGQLYYEAARWDDALAELGLVTGGCRPEYLRLLADALLALILAHRDDWDEADQHLRAIRVEVIPPQQSWANAHYLLLARALAAERTGQLAEAAAILGQSLEPSVADRLPGRYHLMPPLVRLALAAGDTATAAAAAEAAVSDAAADQLPVKDAKADHCRGLMAGHPEPVLAAARYFEATGRPLERAQALEDAAVLAAAQGELSAARQALTVATAVYDSLGAQWDVRRATARLRPYGVRRGRGGYPSRPSTGWDALTPTEVKVAYLVADGRSNPDIAAELYLSRNTVQTHVSHILAKLGARSRAEVVSEAARYPRGDPTDE